MKFVLPKQKKEKEKIIAIDFDGVIHDYKNPVKGRRMGPPMPGTQDKLTLLKQQGFKLVVFSVWGDQHKTISDFMNYYNLPYDDITNIKPNAIAYIDDKAIHFTSWNEVAL